ncbi:MAG: DNA ligase (NAD(+)) LigA [Bacteroidetes bacterium GWE2_39_28]|nr:MAG: DNA ligase (NAD(+)) LigA [Bacteroidetes bacterium GWE2_39_28]OFY15330.1 MAG: DNA ligase (NAD(+)) LigA [Bacteroidetes bacterium GWF2_39_10]OFZ06757.1 MAG: DNA ligase (NAD(+)) LigA [Bacteroidetes bacterium RIFOXYB2_FULL_39_7]OFZ11177.1 MAG: DNA ligase (NAD(+)) LigA [Bacteroidetes bacterium RIFOXYC2_FULL_39_11]HCT93969.1 DNA ligase (NAD(+)) LigA [Rikenellaceae bacterium]
MKISKEQARERISLLRREIEEHNRRYYVDNKPSVSDFEYDLLMQELQFLETKFPQFFSQDSPSVRVGSDLPLQTSKKEFVQVTHKHPMLSLSNTYDKLELEAFNERIKKSIDSDFNYVCELKIDGTAISLTYSNNRLIRAVTRGDGNTGDDVTSNVINISSIPKNLPASNLVKDFEIRGEIFMPWSSFDSLNKERELNEEPLFANPRNAAAGSLKLLDSSEVAKRGLNAILYHVITDTPFFATHYESLQWAKDCGFPVSEHIVLCQDLDSVLEYLENWDEKRKTLDYPTDGVVVKINEFVHQQALGITSKSPKWATAYKFKAEQALTRIISVDYQVGRTGAVTPVANLEPVLLSGTTVKRASLHNTDQMQLLDIHINDYVYIEKGGEIIPKITGVDISKRVTTAEKPLFPEFCPDCNSKLYRAEDEAKFYCLNSLHCPTQIKGKFLHFAGRKAMNILAGEATVDQLYALGYIRKLSDLYHLSKEQLLSLEGWKERSAERFLESLNTSKSTPFQKVLFALGIRHIGETTAKSLASHFGNIANLMEAAYDQLLEVEDIGETVADSIVSYFSEQENISVIKELIEAGLLFEIKNDIDIKSDKLLGKNIVISGNFSISREELKKIIESNSGKNLSSVTSNTTYLLAGEKAGPSKLDKAKKLGITVIDEEEFFKIIK